MNWYRKAFRNDLDTQANYEAKRSFEAFVNMFDKTGHAKGMKTLKTLLPVLDRPSGVWSDVDIQITKNPVDSCPNGDFRVSAAAINFRSLVAILLTIRITNNFSNKDFSSLHAEIRNNIRHEIEHLCNQPAVTEGKANMIGAEQTAENVALYFLMPHEIDPRLRGLMSKSKELGRPLEDILHEEISEIMEYSSGTENQKQSLIQKIMSEYMSRASVIWDLS